jgi:hypothetical protein
MNYEFVVGASLAALRSFAKAQGWHERVRADWLTSDGTSIPLSCFYRADRSTLHCRSVSACGRQERSPERRGVQPGASQVPFGGTLVMGREHPSPLCSTPTVAFQQHARFYVSVPRCRPRLAMRDLFSNGDSARKFGGTVTKGKPGKPPGFSFWAYAGHFERGSASANLAALDH